jgi:hypothetical protein
LFPLVVRTPSPNAPKADEHSTLFPFLPAQLWATRK